MMKLQQEEGFNPLSGCLPMLLQIPVFIGLFHVLRHLSVGRADDATSNNHPSRQLTLYRLQSKAETRRRPGPSCSVLRWPASFHDPASQDPEPRGDVATTRSVILVLLVISAAATLATQLLVKAEPTGASRGHGRDHPEADAVRLPARRARHPACSSTSRSACCSTGSPATCGPSASRPTSCGSIRTRTRSRARVQEVGRALAPKPGARPVRRPSCDRAGGRDVSDRRGHRRGHRRRVHGLQSAAPSQAPRAGQTPARPAADRPAGQPSGAKRPSQAKKRR